RNKTDDDDASIQNTMSEITTEVMASNRFDEDLEWLNQWIEYCDKLFNDSYRVNNDIMVIRTGYQLIVAQINHQLGINEFARNCLRQWIDKSFQEILKRFAYITN